jgi:integrase/recombinase XerD
MDDFATQIELFLDYLTVERGLSENTLLGYGRDLKECAQTLRERKCASFADATYADVTFHLNHLRKRGLSLKTISRRTYALRSFFKFLEGESLVRENPMIRVEPTKTWVKLPEVLAKDEVTRLLDFDAHESRPNVLRLWAMLETLYGSGLRVSELTHLRVGDVHADMGYLICIGKGNKQRLVPLGQWALDVVARWMEKGRVPLLGGRPSEWLFVTRTGEPLSRQQVWSDIKRRVREVGIIRNVSPHTLRHSFATHLLEQGMDLRALQEMLGHADITTTQFYTKIEPEHLKQALRRFHPRS